MRFRCEAAEGQQHQQENEGVPHIAGQRVQQRERRGEGCRGSERKRGREPRKPAREDRETKPKKAFYFSSLKNKKKKKNKHTVSTDGKCSPAEGIIRTGDKGSTEIGNNYFVSVFINENEGH